MALGPKFKSDVEAVKYPGNHTMVYESPEFRCSTSIWCRNETEAIAVEDWFQRQCFKFVAERRTARLEGIVEAADNGG